MFCVWPMCICCTLLNLSVKFYLYYHCAVFCLYMYDVISLQLSCLIIIGILITMLVDSAVCLFIWFSFNPFPSLHFCK